MKNNSVETSGFKFHGRCVWKHKTNCSYVAAGELFCL